MNFIPRIACALAAALFVSTLAACNTVEGIGEDIEATGSAISGWANQTGDQSEPSKKG